MAEGRTALKSYFETGDIPTQAQFASLIDSYINIIDDTSLPSTLVSSSLTSVGTIISGTWEGTAVGDGFIASSANWNTAYSHSQVTSGNPHSVSKSDIGLGSVENTALSTWTGSANITTLGTIGTGTWEGTAVADGFIASSANWNTAYTHSQVTSGNPHSVSLSDLSITSTATEINSLDGFVPTANQILVGDGTKITSSSDLTWDGNNVSIRATGQAGLILESDGTQEWLIHTPTANNDLRFKSDGIDYVTFSTSGNVDVVGNLTAGTIASDGTITSDDSISIKEIAAANADTAAYGQIWVKNDAPNTLWFTDDDGGNHGIVDYTGTPVDNQVAVFTDVNTIEGTNTFRFGDSTSSLAIGTYIDYSAMGDYSFAGGKGFSSGNKDIQATGQTAFNFSENTTSQTDGLGAQASNCAILGGVDHNIGSTGARSVIIGGNNGDITSPDCAVIAGVDNYISDTQHIKCAIIAGESNRCTGAEDVVSCAIIAGYDNDITCTTTSGDIEYCAIIGGSGNSIVNYPKKAVIIGGNDNNITSTYDNSVVIGGDTINADQSFTTYMENACIQSDKAYYLGMPLTDGSWRFIISGDDLLIQQRESGTYNTKQTISGA